MTYDILSRMNEVPPPSGPAELCRRAEMAVIYLIKHHVDYNDIQDEQIIEWVDDILSRRQDV